MPLTLLLGLSLIQTPKFTANWESLQKYQAPDWYRNAKFGIWAHWGPQSVPMDGDWYARNMFIQGTPQYEDHLKRFGHPSEHGYRELIEMWKCEKWDPESLMKLYKEAGAKYFVSMGVHHDNFDLWNSKFHDWNATKHGPHRDVVGEWQKAAKRNGLKFGVSEHLGASYTWWRSSKESDKTGPQAGVPYEGNNPAYQELYHPRPDDKDRGWYSTNPAWHQEWSNRIGDLVANYKPDLLYSDGGVPFGAVGRQVVANLYNQNLDSHGKEQAVYLAKDMTSGEFRSGSLVTDRERGSMAEISPVAWQTDTSVGDWFYNKNWPFRKADWIVHTLVDVVSKNGNLLLNVVQRPDGSLDQDLVETLHTVGTWMKINGESIYGTRPWLTFGEGPTKVGGGHFNEDFPFSAKDIRFSVRGKNTLYATILGAPKTNDLLIQSLAQFEGVTGKVTKVICLEGKQNLAFTQDKTGLHVTHPANMGNGLAYSFKITCSDVSAFRPDLVPKPEPAKVMADSSGNFVLTPDLAESSGGVKVETKDGKPNFGYWDSPSASASWLIKLEVGGTFGVSTEASTENEGSSVRCQFIKQPEKTQVDFHFDVPHTATWSTFVKLRSHTVQLLAGIYEVKLSAAIPEQWKAVNMRAVQIFRIK
jgi:alpha-L-fucosidase